MAEAEPNVGGKCYRVMELYAGIGGMHYALRESSLNYELVQALEINPLVLSTYRHNFPITDAKSRNIDSLTAEEINKLAIDLIVMSPPCQPFCRSGNKKGMEDSRSSSLAHVLNILPNAKFDYLLLENVPGFKESEARTAVAETLAACDMKFQEFLLTPTTLGIPNSRPRYYMIAKKIYLEWAFESSDKILMELPRVNANEKCNVAKVIAKETNRWAMLKKRHSAVTLDKHKPLCVGDVIDGKEDLDGFAVPSLLVKKYGPSMDLVTHDSTTTNCFTKGYGTYLKGTGSYLILNVKNVTDASGLPTVTEKSFRYFTPREIARLMCYPEDFCFPNSISTKQCYRALGNSINVFVVSILLSLLLTE